MRVPSSLALSINRGANISYCASYGTLRPLEAVPAWFSCAGFISTVFSERKTAELAVNHCFGTSKYLTTLKTNHELFECPLLHPVWAFIEALSSGSCLLSFFTVGYPLARLTGENLRAKSQVLHNIYYHVNDDSSHSIWDSYPTTKTNISWGVSSMTNDAPKMKNRTNTPTTAAIFSLPRLARKRISTGARTRTIATNAAESLESTSKLRDDKWTTLEPSGLTFSSLAPSIHCKLY